MVIIKERTHRSLSRQNFILGKGYMENIGNTTTKDLINGATNLAVTGLTEGSKQLLSKILNNTRGRTFINTKSKKLLKEIIQAPQAIIGNGIKKF